MTSPRLDWLPKCSGFHQSLRELRELRDQRGAPAWQSAVALAKHDLDFVQTNSLDQTLQTVSETGAERGVPQAVRLAILSSSTTGHLHAGLRVAASRRGIRLVIYACEYGQFRQELIDLQSALHRFQPDTVLFSLDARHLSAGIHAGLEHGEVTERSDAAIESLVGLWRSVQRDLRCGVLQQTAMPVLPELFGSNESRLPGSGARFIEDFNHRLRQEAAASAVDLVSVDHASRLDGLDAWHDVGMWHRAKQEIALGAAPFYGELVLRVLAAARGGSAKVLVLDLDNTLWGGTIADDGLEGILLGQGTATGEAFADIQAYASELEARGVLLAVCSKNDEAAARHAFQAHPEMVLKPAQIASFIANWEDKASNLRRIAEELNIGLDSLVFLDDSPSERLLVRRELPMVAVPETPDDPALIVRCLSRAGFFEATALTADDRGRGRHYETNRTRREAAASATDLDGYLASLDMTLQWSFFDALNIGRSVQLINKTNQFNLTTRRYSQPAAAAIVDDPEAIGITLRLIDRFGDNGIIGVVIGRRDGSDLKLDTWLMSCRVLGRRVEQATLQILLSEARRRGIGSLIGNYIPSAKNELVRDHYPSLGFRAGSSDEEGSLRFILDVESAPQLVDHVIAIERERPCTTPRSMPI